MTVCIAAISAPGRHLVLVSDRQVSMENFSADDTALKFKGVHRHWGVMLAGEDVTAFPPILDAVKTELYAKNAQFCDLQEIASAFERAYLAEIRTRGEKAVLSRFGLDLPTFTRSGRSRLGPELFNRLAGEIEQFDIGQLTLLVGGHDRLGTPHVFVVRPPGIIEYHDVLGFWAIGSGYHSALSALFFHKFNLLRALPQTIYHACEAKFMAESALGVGPGTAVVVYSPDDSVRPIVLSDSQINRIRKLWQRNGQPRLPKTARKDVAAILSEHGWSMQ